MCDYALYVERVAANAALSMRMTACEPVLAPELVARFGEEPLREGLRGLRDLFARLYAVMGAEPAAYGIPPVPDSKVHHAPSRRKVRGPFEAPLKFLYALGSAGALRERDGRYDLEARNDDLAAAAGALGLRDPGPAREALARAGFCVQADRAEPEGAGCLVARGDTLGRVPLALKVFVDACRMWERRSLKARQMPNVFVTVDCRILRRVDARARLPKLTVRDALPFAPADAVDGLTSLSDYLEGLGYRAEVGRGNLLDGEAHAAFVGARHGRTIFGFTVCRGRANLRLSFRDIGRMVPDIEACPTDLRREVVSQRCGHCGGTGCGRQVRVQVDGEEAEICHFGIPYIWRWQPADIAHIKRLLAVQDGLYREAAA